jgi:DNA polymerase
MAQLVLDPHVAASALAWLEAAGIDTLVEARPRNWLASRPSPPASTARAVPAPAGPVAAAPAAPLPSFETLDALNAALAALAHPLNTGTAPALAAGPAQAPLMLLSEQPLPPGSAEMALVEAMLAAIGLAPAVVARAAILPWPAPAGRAARDAEIATFAPWLEAALALHGPATLLALGSRPARLADPDAPAASLRGRALKLAGIPTIATYAPSMLLSQPALKAAAWDDLQFLQSVLGSSSQ